jgi:CRISPR/Cas system-associated protein Cas10 (large subunit of type III CRISPR-Cas system)
MNYIALQFSGIQKALLRHPRLWSIAGTSEVMDYLSSVELPEIAKQRGGEVIISGGGKFTVAFEKEEDARIAKKEIEKVLSTVLPFVEFQIAGPEKGENLSSVIKELTKSLRISKIGTRGYGVTYNPQLKSCEECGEFPAEKNKKIGDKKVCRFCYEVLNYPFERGLPLIREIYKAWCSGLEVSDEITMPRNFEDLFGKNEDLTKKRRLGVWVSDLNNMGKKIPCWTAQEDKKIVDTFNALNNFNKEVMIETLREVFSSNSLIKKDNKYFSPFRLIIAGGDDLCIVMSAEYILNFACSFYDVFKRKLKTYEERYEFFREDWLSSKAKDPKNPPGPFTFASAFIVIDMHTPFIKIHDVAEELLKNAKQKTRDKNMVNWRIMAVEEDITEKLLKYNKPMSFEELLEYYQLCEKYSNFSRTKIYQLARLLIETGQDKELFLRKVLGIPDALKDKKDLSRLLREPFFDSETYIDTHKLATFLELLNLYMETKK